MNQYVTYLYSYERTRKKKDDDQIVNAHYQVMAFLEMERLDLHRLIKTLAQFVTTFQEKGGNLKLNATERRFLGTLMEANERKGTWNYKGEKNK
ncbi:hypothetical protein [Ralstonia mannitolilytica]|nr:hypothetical protein [Ralstonia mannitolilytica]